MSNSTETSALSDSFPEEWRMPLQPGLAKECGLRTFGFVLYPTQVMAIAKKLGFDTRHGYSGCKDKVFDYLVDELPDAWRHLTYGSFQAGGNGPTIHAKIVFHNTNKNEEERDRLPDMESIQLVYKILCAKEGPGWFLYDRVQ
ncbi:hypothetical protein CPC08DRAFT_716461 [Agrocybe pediades]|nr:hypothetical protein CPC08DRAFT_716461 [Agrocybe pediades]